MFNPQAVSNWKKTSQQMYVSHEGEKKTEYMPRTFQVDMLFSTSGGMGRECDKLVTVTQIAMNWRKGHSSPLYLPLQEEWNLRPGAS